MKKHTVFAIFLAFIASATTQAQSDAGLETLQQIRQAAEQHLDVLNSRDYDRSPENCDCKKCQKGKKSKKHKGCNQRGNHYGKHKNHHDKHSCCCENQRKRDCDDDDDNDERRCGRDNDHRGYGSNGRDRDDSDGRRYEQNRHDRNPRSNSQTRAGQKTSTAKVKTRPTPTAKPTSAPTNAKKRAASRPAGVR